MNWENKLATSRSLSTPRKQISPTQITTRSFRRPGSKPRNPEDSRTLSRIYLGRCAWIWSCYWLIISFWIWSLWLGSSSNSALPIRSDLRSQCFFRAKSPIIFSVILSDLSIFRGSGNDNVGLVGIALTHFRGDFRSQSVLRDRKTLNSQMVKQLRKRRAPTRTVKYLNFRCTMFVGTLQLFESVNSIPNIMCP